LTNKQIYHREYHKKYYQKRKEYYLTRNVDRRIMLRNYLNEYKNNKFCVTCKESATPCLDFHHIDPQNKIESIAWFPNKGYSIKKLHEEIDKCIIICANCHRKLHNNLLSIIPS